MLLVIKLIAMLAGMVIFILNMDTKPKWAFLGTMLIAGGALA